MAVRKKFKEHSARWQREALRDGIDPKKWDRYLKLSPKSQKAADPRKYGQGQSVAQQRTTAKQNTVADKIIAVLGDRCNPNRVRINSRHMTAKDIRAVMRRNGNSLLEYIRLRATERVSIGEINPFWYR